MDESKNVPQMLRIREIAEMYGLPIHFVRALVNNGEVEAVRVGNKILVNADKFCTYLNHNRLQPVRKDTAEKTAANECIETIKPRIAPIPIGRGR